MKNSVTYLLTLMLLSTGTAFAATQSRNATLATKVSTLGLGAELAFTNSNSVELFASLNFLDLSHSIDVNEVSYDANLRLHTMLSGVRYHPNQSNFYVGGAMGLNNNTLALEPKLSGDTIKLNGNTYSTAAIGDTKMRVKYNTFSPLLMAGWQSKKPKEVGVGFFAEAGALYNGDATLSATPPCSAGGSGCRQINADFDRERAALEDEIDKYFSIIPVAAVGMRYTF